MDLQVPAAAAMPIKKIEKKLTLEPHTAITLHAEHTLHKPRVMSRYKPTLF